MALPNCFRWLDHIQHLPGMLDQVQNNSLFTSFPNPEVEGSGPSKRQLKKAAKAQAAKEAKAAAKGGDGGKPQQA